MSLYCLGYDLIQVIVKSCVMPFFYDNSCVEFIIMGFEISSMNVINNVKPFRRSALVKLTMTVTIQLFNTLSM